MSLFVTYTLYRPGYWASSKILEKHRNLPPRRQEAEKCWILDTGRLMSSRPEDHQRQGSSTSSEPSLAGPQLRAFEREGFGVVWPEESFGHGLKFGARGRFLPLRRRTNTLAFGNAECTYPLFARAKNLTFSAWFNLMCSRVTLFNVLQ
jgi:hypothetical protein